MDKDIVRKIEIGDGLDDRELDAALELYTRLEADLDLLGEKFFLARVEITRTCEQLRRFKSWRSEPMEAVRCAAGTGKAL